MRNVYDTLKAAVNEFLAKNTFEMGAALAYYTVFSLAPLLLIAIAIASAVFGQQAAEGRIADEIGQTVGPTVAKAIEETVRHSSDSGGGTVAGIIGAVLLLFGAGGVFVQLQDSLNAIWGVSSQAGSGVWGFVKNRLLSFAMVVVVGFLLLASLIVSTALNALGDRLTDVDGATMVTFLKVLNAVVSFGVITVLFGLIYHILPDTHIAWRDVWTGALITALLFSVGKYLIGLYLAHSSVASAFGAAGSLVLILTWVYYASQILLFGAVITHVIAARHQRAPAETATAPTLRHQDSPVTAAH